MSSDEILLRRKPCKVNQTFPKWKFFLDKGLSEEFAQYIFTSCKSLNPTKRVYRNRGELAITLSSGEVAKVYVKKDTMCFSRLDPKKIVRSARMLRRGYLLKEGEAYIAFKKRKIPTPRLLFFGDIKVFNFRIAEIIVTMALDGVNIQEQFKATKNVECILDVIRLIAYIHNKGLAHGDCMLHNFIINECGLFAIDLENYSILSPYSQLKDLSDFCMSLLRVGGDRYLFNEALTLYDSLTELDLPASINKTFFLAEQKVQKPPK